MSQQAAQQGGRLAPAKQFLQRCPATVVLLAVNVALFAAMLRAGRGDVSLSAVAFGVKDNALIQHGQAWRLVTAAFLHGGPTHLLVNCLSLYWLGRFAEPLYGTARFLTIYLVAAVVASLASYAGSPADSLGASGALFGLIGVGLVIPVRFRAILRPEFRNRLFREMFTITVINLAIGAAVPMIDNHAHVGGLIGGAAVACVLTPPYFKPAARDLFRDRAAAAVAAVLCAAAVWCGLLEYRWSRHHVAIGTPPVAVIVIPSAWIGDTASGPWHTAAGDRIDVGPEDARRPELAALRTRAPGYSVYAVELRTPQGVRYTARRFVSSTDVLTCIADTTPGRLNAIKAQVDAMLDGADTLSPNAARSTVSVRSP